MLGLQGMTADSSIFDPASNMAGQAKYFNSDCEATMEAGAADAPGWCASSLRLIDIVFPVLLSRRLPGSGDAA